MADPVRIGSGSILLMPDARQFRRNAQTELSKIQLMHRVTLMPQIQRVEYRRDADTKLDAIKLIHRVTLSPKLQAGFRASANSEVNTALRGLSHTLNLNLRLDTGVASAQMTAWRRLEESRPVRIKVIADHVGGRTGLPERPVSAGGFDQTAFKSGLADMVRQVDSFAKDEFGDGHSGPRRARNRFRITPELDPDLRNNPRTRDTMRRASYQFNDAFRLRIQPNLAGLQLRLPLGGLGIAAIPEMISQVGGLTASLTQLMQTGLALPGMFGGLGATIATVAVGVHGLSAAWKALSSEEGKSTQTADQQRTARRAVVDSVQDEQRARWSLTDTIESEQRRQRDLSLQLRGAKLSEAEAVLAIQDAEATLREGRFDNARERDHALLAREEAIQNLMEVRNRNADMAQDVAKNEQTGVMGSDSVLSATQALSQASERVAEATAKLAEGGGALGKASAKAQEEMNKLSPSAREFIQTLFDARPAMREFAQSIQEPLMKGMGPAFSELFNSPAIQTNLRTGMQGLASQLNAVLRTGMKGLGTPESGGLLSRLFGNTTDAAKRFNDQVVGPLQTGLLRLTAAGSATLPRIVDAMGILADRFSGFIEKADKDGSLKRWTDQGLDAFTQIGRIMGNLWRSLEGISRAFGGDFLTNINKMTTDLTNFLNSTRGQSDLRNFISDTKNAMDQWKPILKEIPGLLKTAFDTGRTAVMIFLPIIQLFMDLLTSCPGLIQGVVTAFVAWKTIGPLITGVQGALNGVGMMLTNVGTGFGTTKKQAREAAGAVDNAFKNTAGAGGAIHRTARSVEGLAGALSSGGPILGLALTGAMIAIDKWISKEEDAQRTTANLAQTTNQLASALDRVTGMATEQNRMSIGEAFADFKPASAQGLSGKVFEAAKSLGVGGDQGADLVTAALPGGTDIYNKLMGQMRDRVRPAARDFIQNQGLQLQQMGITEDDVLDAFLGMPDALAKIDKLQQLGIHTVDLGVMAEQVKRRGGDVLQASLVAQAVNEQRRSQLGATGKFGQAAGAARPPVGLAPSAALFGADARAAASGGEYKIVSFMSPDTPGISALLSDPSSSVTVIANPKGADPSGKDTWTYTLNKEKAQQYLTGVPAHAGGGPTKAGLAVMHEPEYVISDRGTRKYPQEFLESVNQGTYDLPHYDVGGPYPPDPMHPRPDVLHGGTVGAVTSPPMPPNVGDASPIPDAADQIPSITSMVPGLGAQNFNPLNMLSTVLGGGGGSGGGSGSAPDLTSIAAQFGQILMGGVLGFFGIDPKYINDISKVINFGLGKVTSGAGYSDPAAQALVEGNIVGYDQDGSPLYYLPSGQSGTALPGLTGGAGVPGPGSLDALPPGVPGAGAKAPGGAIIGANPASKANFGGPSPPDISGASLAARGIAPVYDWSGKGSNPKPQWVQDLAGQFGLTVNTDPHGALHSAGYAWDFNGPQDKLDAFAQFIQTNLAPQTLQLIHANPTTGQKWGIAAGTRVGPGTTAPNYFSANWAGHGDHVHWATDTSVLFNPTTTGWGTGSGRVNIGTYFGGAPKPVTPAAPAPGALAPGQVTTPGSAPYPGDTIDIPGVGGGGGGGPIGRGGGMPQGLIYSPTHGIVGYLGGGPGGPGGKAPAKAPEGLSGLQAMAYQLYIASGMPPGEWKDFDELEKHEAGWNPNAQNPGSTAFGLGQFLNSTWASVGGSKTTDPKMQLQYMFAYLKQRYHGSPREAWQLWQQRSPHWYDWGGDVPPGLTTILNQTRLDELMMNQPQIQATAAQMVHPDDMSALQAQTANYLRPTGATPPSGPNTSGANIPQQVLDAIPRTADRIVTPTAGVGGQAAGPLPSVEGEIPHEATREKQPTPIAPPTTPSQPSPIPSGAPGAKASTIPIPEPGARPEQPDIGKAPESTDHELPAIKQGVTSAAATMGNWAAIAASMGMMGAGGGAGGGAAGSMIAGLFQQGGKIVNAAINVAESALVGTATPGTTDNPYGVQIKGVQAPNSLASVDQSTHYHGDLVTNDMDEFFRRQELRDSQHMQTQLNSQTSYMGP